MCLTSAASFTIISQVQSVHTCPTTPPPLPSPLQVITPTKCRPTSSSNSPSILNIVPPICTAPHNACFVLSSHSTSVTFHSSQPPQLGHYDHDGPISPYPLSPPTCTSISFHTSRQSHSSSFPLSPLVSRSLYPLHLPFDSSSLQSHPPLYSVSMY